MAMRPRTYRVLACGLALFGIAAANAAGDSTAANRLAGTWNNDQSGENIVVERAPIGWVIWISNSGEARFPTTQRTDRTSKSSARDLSAPTS